jgi:putative glutamine amidotransferase
VPGPLVAVVTRRPEWLAERYHAWLTRAGFHRLLLLSGEHPAQLDRLPECDALVLTGGGDFARGTGAYADDAEAARAGIYHENPARESVERAALDWAFAHDRPVLGICRGLQMMNVHAGGTLIPDIQNRLGPAADPAHRLAPATLAAGTEHALAHPVTVETDSQLARFLPAADPVNSHHHQAIDRLADAYRAVAWSPDGIIEAIEHRTRPRVWSVQFHPELIQPPDWVSAWTRACLATDA